jgi:hypothetical protein
LANCPASNSRPARVEGLVIAGVRKPAPQLTLGLANDDASPNVIGRCTAPTCATTGRRRGGIEAFVGRHGGMKPDGRDGIRIMIKGIAAAHGKKPRRTGAQIAASRGNDRLSPNRTPAKSGGASVSAFVSQAAR